MKVVFIVAMLLVGCTKAQKHLVTLEMYDGTSTTIFTVEADGVVVYGGGAEALAGKTTWQGELRVSQIKKLRSLIQSSTFDEPKTSHKKRFVIATELDGRYTKTTVDINNYSAQELFYFLQEATISDRISSILEHLPKPTMDVISDREVKGARQ